MARALFHLICHCQCRFEQEQQWAAQQQTDESPPSGSAQQSTSQQLKGLEPIPGADDAGAQASSRLMSDSMNPGSAFVQDRGHTSSSAETMQSSPHQAGMTWPPKYADQDCIPFQPAHRRSVTQHTMSELEQQGGPAGKSPAKQAVAQQAVNPEELAALSAQNPRGGHRPQHTMSEQEQQGNMAQAVPAMQGSIIQPSVTGPSPQEVELVASQQNTGRVSPTRVSPTQDLTELEQQGSFTLPLAQSQIQAGNLDGVEAAELAMELARRKGTQAELERQYSQLQLQHQQVVQC